MIEVQQNAHFTHDWKTKTCCTGVQLDEDAQFLSDFWAAITTSLYLSISLRPSLSSEFVKCECRPQKPPGGPTVNRHQAGEQEGYPSCERSCITMLNKNHIIQYYY